MNSKHIKSILDQKGNGAYFFFTLDLSALGIIPISLYELCTSCGKKLDRDQSLFNIAIRINQSCHEINVVTEKANTCTNGQICPSAEPERHTTLYSVITARDRYEHTYLISNRLPPMKDFKDCFHQNLGKKNTVEILSMLCLHHNRLLGILCSLKTNVAPEEVSTVLFFTLDVRDNQARCLPTSPHCPDIFNVIIIRDAEKGDYQIRAIVNPETDRIMEFENATQAVWYRITKLQYLYNMKRSLPEATIDARPIIDFVLDDTVKITRIIKILQLHNRTMEERISVYF